MYLPSSHMLCVFSLIGCALFGKSSAKRYLYCSEGCCPHEFCAYGKICYPVLRCSVPCPDGNCENGLCMPSRPCRNDRQCPDAFACAMNFNLGYNTCQYDLDIGKTTCVDRYGNSVATKLGKP